ncbi:hypothetical protein BGZ99_000865 [Dissophora globulifera]|uniref:glutathione transferase n=1 Tax=Dissophora globulifera TaxID=979702 RepID=A0A9P6R1Z2_9FUNG|nr:hypothetical protein BGZ99_000865 [Dissophora globulifera]
MTLTKLPIATKASSQFLSQAIKSSNSSYKILYFNLHARAEVTRTLLAFSGAKWEEISIDWATQKEQTPFQCIPVLYETTADGTILQIGETEVIERYLAKKFNLLGQNEWEQLMIEQYHSSTLALQVMYRQNFLFSPPEKRVESATSFYNDIFKKFVTVHERYLEKNGSNGHYIGQHLSLADIKTTSFLDRMTFLNPEGADLPVSAEKTPNLWKVREAVNSHPNIVAWNTSQRHQELDNLTATKFKK